MIISRSIRFTPGGERFPAKRHNDLIGPMLFVRSEPSLVASRILRIKAKLPCAV